MPANLTEKEARLLFNAGAIDRLPSKYRNKRRTVDGITFDSIKEANHYSELKLLEKAGELWDLELQPRFPIKINGELICTYVADFKYTCLFKAGGRASITDKIVDVKGVRTREYKLKKRLMKAVYGIDIVEV